MKFLFSLILGCVLGYYYYGYSNSVVTELSPTVDQSVISSEDIQVNTSDILEGKWYVSKITKKCQGLGLAKLDKMIKLYSMRFQPDLLFVDLSLKNVRRAKRFYVSMKIDKDQNVMNLTTMQDQYKGNILLEGDNYFRLIRGNSRNKQNDLLISLQNPKSGCRVILSRHKDGLL